MDQVNELKFIQLVRTKPILYDSRCREYRNHELRKAAWDQIATKVGVTGSECKDIWTKLRNSYTNALKRRLYKPSSSKFVPKWKFEDQMSFLYPCFEPRTNYPTVEVVNSESASSDPGIEIVDDLSNSWNGAGLIHDIKIEPDISTEKTIQPTSPILPNKNSSRKRRRDKSMDGLMKMMHKNSSVWNEFMTKVALANQRNYAQDDTEQFFLTMARNTKKLSPEEQAKVKMELSNAVFQAEIRDIQRTEPQHNSRHHDSPQTSTQTFSANFESTISATTKRTQVPIIVISRPRQDRGREEVINAVYESDIRDNEHPRLEQNPRLRDTPQASTHTVSTNDEPASLVSKRASYGYHNRRTWNYAQVEILFEIWQEKLSKFRECARNAHVYTEMADEMKNRGAVYNPIEIKYKMHNLRQKYRAEKRSSEKSGRPSEWELYEKLHHIMDSYGVNEHENSTLLPCHDNTLNDSSDAEADHTEPSESNTSFSTAPMHSTTRSSTYNSRTSRRPPKRLYEC